MTRVRRWDPCVYHRGDHANAFLREYLAQAGRQYLLVVGAGFDPRSVRIASAFPNDVKKDATVILIREDRPNPLQTLVERAKKNGEQLRNQFPKAGEHTIPIFARDNAVIGGRQGAKLMSAQKLDGITDIIVDMSALSIGVAFPIIKHFLTILAVPEHSKTNLHVLASHNSSIDDAITSMPSDAVAPIHGFRGGLGLDDKSRAAMLWMPQLSLSKRLVLNRIFQMLRNVQEDTVVCPILPFPSSRPRLCDELIEEFSQELQEAWSVDVRDLIYADEKSPLDLYRTILTIDDARKRVFASVGGSQIVLSPLGSKALSLGALMAALERDFTILYVESIGYTLNEEQADSATGSDELVHIWLHGDAYATQSAKEGNSG
jgi:hypothetical protein